MLTFWLNSEYLTNFTWNGSFVQGRFYRCATTFVVIAWRLER